MNKIKIALIIVILCIVIAGVTCGAAYASWFYTGVVSNSNTTIGFDVPEWDFVEDSDYAKIGNINRNYCVNLEESQETSKVCGSAEAIRFTNTTGTATDQEHRFDVDFNRTYTVGEIKIQKVSFDYYHAEKREQNGKGFPKVVLLFNHSTKGNTQGGENNITAISPYTSVEIGDGWWHLEYFITALTPTFGSHGDTVISETQKINGVRISDKNIMDYDPDENVHAFIVIDNLQISTAACSKLGLFNRTDYCYVDGFFWVKVAWAGEVHSITFTFSDDGSDNPIAEHDDDPATTSPFYIKGLRVGTVDVTVTMELGDEHQILSITKRIRVLAS